MQVGVITKEELENYKPLLLPDVADAVERGVPVTVLAVTDDELADDNALTVGALAGWVEDETFWILSLFVAPEFRRHGCARMLTESLQPILEDGGIESMAACFAVIDEESGTLVPFFRSMGFEELEDTDENTYLIQISDLNASPFFSKAGGTSKTFADVDERVLQKAQRMAETESLPTPAGGLTGPATDRQISTLQVKDSEVTAYVAWDHSILGKLTLAGAWAEDADPAVLPALLRGSFLKIREIYPQETELIVQTVNENSAALVNALAPEAKPIAKTFKKYFM